MFNRQNNVNWSPSFSHYKVLWSDGDNHPPPNIQAIWPSHTAASNDLKQLCSWELSSAPAHRLSTMVFPRATSSSEAALRCWKCDINNNTAESNRTPKDWNQIILWDSERLTPLMSSMSGVFRTLMTLYRLNRCCFLWTKAKNIDISAYKEHVESISRSLHARSVWHWAASPLPVLCPSPQWNLTAGTIIIPQQLAPNLWPGLNVRRCCVVSWRALVSPQMSGERGQWCLSTTPNGPWFPVQGPLNSHHYVSLKNQNGLCSRVPPRGLYHDSCLAETQEFSQWMPTGSKSKQLKI